MDDLGNIVYVLIAVGWFALNMYKKSQQKKQQQPKAKRQQPRRQESNSDSGEWKKSLEDLILEQFGEKIEEPVKPEPIPAHPNEDKFLQTDLTHSHLADDYQMSSTEMESHRVQRQVRKVVVEKVEEESLMDKILPEGFDLRQAVVLNAILERPYK